MFFHIFSAERSWKDFRKNKWGRISLSVYAHIGQMKWKKTVIPDFVKHFIIDTKQVSSPCTAIMEKKNHIIPSK